MRKDNFYYMIIIAIVVAHFIISRKTKVESLMNSPLKSESSIYVSKVLDPYIDDFISSAKDNNYDCSKIGKLDSITFTSPQGTWAGCTSFYLERDTLRGTIKIDYALLADKDTFGIRFVLYHELGHWLGLEHNECFIMRKNYSPQIKEVATEDDWGNMKWEMFRKLKQKRDRN